MELRDTPDEAAFRAELRGLARREPAGGAAGRPRRRRSGSTTRSAASGAGCSTTPATPGLTWPKEYGGAGAPYSFQAIFYEEMARGAGAGARRRDRARHGGADDHGPRQRRAEAGASLEDPLGRGDLVPGLLGARRRLRPRGRAHARRAARRQLRRQRAEGLVVVRAHRRLLHPRHAERPGRAALSQPDLPDRRHDAPGVEVRPLRQITGEAEFNEIFFNDVEVPVSNRLGEEGEGWQVAMTTLLHERGTLGFALTAALESGVDRCSTWRASARRRRRHARARRGGVDRAAGAPLHELPLARARSCAPASPGPKARRSSCAGRSRTSA